MRAIAFLLFLLLPLSLSAEECPLGYTKNSSGICTKMSCKAKPPKCGRGQSLDDTVCPQRCAPACPTSFFFRSATKQCESKCPNGGTPGIGQNGDMVCKLPERLNKAARYAKNCQTLGREYIPHLGMCGGLLKQKQLMDPKSECPKGQVAAFEGDKYLCKKGSSEEALKKMQAKLQKSGLSYNEYLNYLAGAQTNIDALKMLRGRISQVKQEDEIAKKRPVNRAGKITCIQGYVPTEDGYCKPEKPCSLYRCKNGTSPAYKKQGDYYYCSCPE